MKTRMSEWQDGIALPHAFIVTRAPEASRPITTARMSTGSAIVLEPRGDVGEVLAGQVGHGVEHVGAGVEQEPAAGQCRLLAPRARRSASPSPARRRR